MKNPYKISTVKTKRMYVPVELVKKCRRYNRIAQREADLEHGKGKYKVPENYGLLVIGRLLK